MKYFPVSVIIANFNSEYFLIRCINSINNYKTKPSEIIIVDDKSTDISPKIAKSLKKKYANLKIFYKNKNQGAAEARKFALKIIKNEIISYIDADDFVESGAIFFAYKKLINTNSDICLFDLVSYKNGNFKTHSANPSKSSLSNKEAVEATLGKWNIHFLGVFKKKLFIDSYKKIDDSLDNIFNKDELVCRLYFHLSKKVVKINKKYFYRSNQNSTTNKICKKKLEELISNMWIIKFAKTNYNWLFYSCVKWAISVAYFLWKNRKKIGTKNTKTSLKKFIDALKNELNLITFFFKCPKHFFIYVFLKIYTINVNEAIS